MEYMFGGHEYGWWLELERRVSEKCSFDYSSMISEIVELRGKVNFYEYRVKQMALEADRLPKAFV